MQYYLPLPQNPKYYVWDVNTRKLYSAGYGKKVGAPNGLYELKYSKDHHGYQGFRVTMIPNTNFRQTFSIYEIEKMIADAKTKNILIEYQANKEQQDTPIGFMVGFYNLTLNKSVVTCKDVFDTYGDAIEYCKHIVTTNQRYQQDGSQEFEIFEVRKTRSIKIRIPPIEVLEL